MVEYSISLDPIFGSLADTTRRDILERIVHGELTVGEIARPYDMSLAAVSKHLKVLERARLIVKRRRGKEQLVSINVQGFADAENYLQQYRQQWEQRLDALDKYLKASK